MKFNSEIGKVYDSIFFFHDYYSGSKTLKQCTFQYGDTEFMAHCLNQIRNDIKPPEILRPLFTTVRSQINPITTFWSENFRFTDDNIDTFVEKISKNPDKILRLLLDNIFEGYQKMNSVTILPSSDPSEYIQALQSLNATEDFKLQLSLLISNFDYAISVFIDLYKKVYYHVSALHDKYQKEIATEFEQIQSEKTTNLYSKVISSDISSFDEVVITIALLNQYIVYESRHKNQVLHLLLGIRSTQIIEDENKFNSISLPGFLIACGNEIRINAINAIAEHKELTLSQLAKLQNVSPATMLRHIEVLLDAHLIQVSRRDGLQIFYRINNRIFQNVKSNLFEFVETMESPKGVAVK